MRLITLIWRGYGDQALRGVLTIIAIVLCIIAYTVPTKAHIELAVVLVPVAICLARWIKYGPIYKAEARFLNRIRMKTGNRNRFVQRKLDKRQLVLDKGAGERHLVTLSRHPVTMVSPMFIGKSLMVVGNGAGRVTTPIKSFFRGLWSFARRGKLAAFISLLVFVGVLFLALAGLVTAINAVAHYRLQLTWILSGVLLVGLCFWYRFWQIQTVVLTSRHIIVFSGFAGVPYKIPLPSSPELVLLEQSAMSKVCSAVRLTKVPWYIVKIPHAPGQDQLNRYFELKGIAAASALHEMGYFATTPKRQNAEVEAR